MHTINFLSASWKDFWKALNPAVVFCQWSMNFQKGVPSGANFNVKGVESAIYLKKKYDIYIFVF